MVTVLVSDPLLSCTDTEKLPVVKAFICTLVLPFPMSCARDGLLTLQKILGLLMGMEKVRCCPTVMVEGPLISCPLTMLMPSNNTQIIGIVINLWL